MNRTILSAQLILLLALTLTSACNRHGNSNVAEYSGNDVEQAFSGTNEGEGGLNFAVTQSYATCSSSDSELQLAKYVVEIFEDSKGNLWFGTMEKGAARFDGKKLTYFTFADGLCGMTISSFAEDKDGNIWLGSHTGLSKFDGETFTTVWTTEGWHDKGLGWVSVTADADGNIWAANNSGVFRYDGTTFVEFDLPIDIEKINDYSITKGRASLKLTDKNGNLWFGIDGYGVLKYDGETFTHLNKDDGLCSNTVTSIMEDRQGKIWFACMQSYQPEMIGDGGLCVYDGNTFTKFLGKPGLHENDLYTIYEDNSGIIWIGASGFGVYHYDGQNFEMIKETNRMDLTDRFGLQAALEDKNGTLWFGFSGGLFRLKDGAIVNITKTDLEC